jgi:(1->4)-alpha-D-glucan 1-alpha-D-glucosylmutase
LALSPHRTPDPRPLAAYRLQLTPEWPFEAAAELAPYLARLGVSHVYTSPVLEAEEGSQHGYDVVDHGRVRAELGGEAALERFVSALAAHGLAWLVDIVPNHVSVATPRRNRWWWATLRDGPEAREAQAFDVDWAAGGGRLVLPVLGAPLDEVLDQGQVAVVAGDGEPVLRIYGETELPLRPDTHGEAAAAGADRAALAAVLERQHYRLDWWRRPTRNYRCFFDISDLAALRVEEPWVFEASHRLVRDWVDAGWLAGVRVDHVDGLLDPAGYLCRLRDVIGDRWLVVEKILTPGEVLPPEWPVDGTTGYEFARLAAGALVSRTGVERLDDLYAEIAGRRVDYAQIEHQAKREALERRLGPDLAQLDRLAAAALGPQAGSGPVRRRALTELLASFSVYRTYLGEGAGASPRHREDRELLEEAVERAERHRPEVAPVVEALAEAVADPADEAQRRLQERLQQVSGPVMAKGGEDTALYRYHRLLALNDVGFAPDLVPDPAAFHREMAALVRHHPFSMVTTSTHDTKRSEDVRARLAVVSELPDRWAELTRRWLARTEAVAVDAPVRYLALQTVVGAWPIDVERLRRYLVKAAREAGERTSWTDPDAGYEAALDELAGALTDREGLGAEIAGFVDDLRRPWSANVIGQTILRLTAGGVPDTYRGTELVDLSLVDPDNRRPVDWNRRRDLLGALEGQGQDADLIRAWNVGDLDRAKLLTIYRLCHLRREWPDAFGPDAPHRPLPVAGPNADRLMAYGRGDRVAVLVTRLPATTDAGAWQATTVVLPAGRWRPVLSDDGPFDAPGGPVALGALLAPVPHRVLRRDP